MNLGTRLSSLTPYSDQLILSLGTFLCVFLSAYFLPGSDAGAFGYVVTLKPLMAILVSYTFVQSDIHLQQTARIDGRQPKVSADVLIWSSITGLFATLVACLLIKSSVQHLAVVAALIFFDLSCEALLHFERKKLIAEKRFGPNIGMMAAAQGSRVALIVALQPESLMVFMLCMCVGSACVLLVHLRRPAVAFGNPWSDLKTGAGKLGHTLKLWQAAPLQYLWAASPIWLLGELVALKYAGYYVLARSVTNLANIVVEGVDAHVFPRYVERFYARRPFSDLTAAVLKVLGAMWVGGVLGLLVFVAFIPELEVLSPYEKVADLFAPLWAMMLFVMLAKVASLILRAVERFNGIPLAYAVGVAGNLVLAWLLSDVMGPWEMAVVNATTAAMIAAILWAVVWKRA